MAHVILATARQSIGWFRGSPLSSEGTVSAIDAESPNLMISWPLSAPILKAIRETKTLTAGVILGLLIIFAVGYYRSPWRKLPPSPRRLPILGNALQLRDKSWLLSKDCKERFGELITYLPRWILRCTPEHCRGGYVP